MPRYRLLPSPAQEAVLRDHCAHARYVWNLAVEQHAHWHLGRKGAPGYLEQCRQLTDARAEHDWPVNRELQLFTSSTGARRAGYDRVTVTEAK